MSILAALGIGLVLGAITGMPLGVVNVAIVDAALAREHRRAHGIALGGALADMAHALVAFVGLSHVITSRPQLQQLLAVVAALVIVTHAVLSWRRSRGDGGDQRLSGHRTAGDVDTLGRGLATGLVLTLPNPAALGAWAAVAAVLWPAATTGEALAIAAGVGAGSAVWFVLLARLVGRATPTHRALRVVPRAALVVFVAIAVAGVVRVVA